MARKPHPKQMRTPLDRSVRNLWDNYVEHNNVAKQLSYPRMISYREILRLSHKVYSQHQLESSLHCLQCMIREVLTAARSEKLISRSSKEHPARILAHLPYLQFRSCRNYSQRIGWAKLFMNDDVIRCFEMVHREQSETVK